MSNEWFDRHIEEQRRLSPLRFLTEEEREEVSRVTEQDEVEGKV